MLNSMRKVIVQYQLLTGHYDFKNVEYRFKIFNSLLCLFTETLFILLQEYKAEIIFKNKC